MKFKLYQDTKNEWRWRLLARNGRVIADSGEGYKRKAACAKAMFLLADADKKALQNAAVRAEVAASL